MKNHLIFLLFNNVVLLVRYFLSLISIYFFIWIFFVFICKTCRIMFYEMAVTSILDILDMLYDKKLRQKVLCLLQSPLKYISPVARGLKGCNINCGGKGTSRPGKGSLVKIFCYWLSEKFKTVVTLIFFCKRKRYWE